MVRTYKRNTDAGEWSQEKMKEAVNKVHNKELTLRKTAEISAVPFTSLQRRVTSSRGIIKRRGGQPALDENAEKKLGDRLLHLASHGFGITPKTVRKYAFEFAKRQNIKHNLTEVLEWLARTGFIASCKEIFVYPLSEDWIQCNVC